MSATTAAFGRRRALLEFEPDGWDPPVSLSPFSLEPFSESAFGKNVFSLWAGAFHTEPFSVFSNKSLVLFCFITD